MIMHQEKLGAVPTDASAPSDGDVESCAHWRDACQHVPPRCLATWCPLPSCRAHTGCTCRVLRPRREAVSGGEVSTSRLSSPCLSPPSDASDEEKETADLVAWHACRFSQTAQDGWE